MPGAFDGTRKLSLKLGRYACYASGQNFALLVDESLEQFNVFVIHVLDVLCIELVFRRAVAAWFVFLPSSNSVLGGSLVIRLRFRSLPLRQSFELCEPFGDGAFWHPS